MVVRATNNNTTSQHHHHDTTTTIRAPAPAVTAGKSSTRRPRSNNKRRPLLFAKSSLAIASPWLLSIAGLLGASLSRRRGLLLTTNKEAAWISRSEGVVGGGRRSEEDEDEEDETATASSSRSIRDYNIMQLPAIDSDELTANNKDKLLRRRGRSISSGIKAGARNAVELPSTPILLPGNDRKKNRKVEEEDTDVYQRWLERLYNNDDNDSTSTEAGAEEHSAGTPPRIWAVQDDHDGSKINNGHDPRTNRRAASFQNEMPNNGSSTSGHEDPTGRMQQEFPKNCLPRSEWHTYHFPTCNMFHELQMVETLLPFPGRGDDDDNRLVPLSQGATRAAWRYQATDGNDGKAVEPSTVVLKTLLFEKDLDELIADHQRIDALALERLTKSHFVVDVYGHCGTSTFNEFAEYGDFGHFFKAKVNEETEAAAERENGNNQDHINGNATSLTSRDLLSYATDAALALADIHEVDGPNNVTSMVQHDYSPKNLLVMENGRLKVNDFNDAKFLRWDSIRNVPCHGFIWDSKCGQSTERTHRRSPEECRSATRQRTSEKVETYHLGAILYFILSGGRFPYRLQRRSDGKTTHRPKPDTVKNMILKGQQADLPLDVEEDVDPIRRQMAKIMRTAFTYDPTKRPRARDIANVLSKIEA